MEKRKLPPWAKLTGKISKREGSHERAYVEVDAKAAYDALLKELEVDEIDQYWLEVAYQFIKMDIQSVVGFDVTIRIRDADKKYRQKNYPEGRGWHAATKGREARGHYKRIRGFLP